MDTIVELALAARTMADVDRLEEELIGRGYSRERMLGDIEANYSSLANSADPRVLVPERITNCEDAILEFILRPHLLKSIPWCHHSMRHGRF